MLALLMWIFPPSARADDAPEEEEEDEEEDSTVYFLLLIGCVFAFLPPFICKARQQLCNNKVSDEYETEEM